MLQGGVLLLLVLAASYVTIGRILITNIDRYRADIESVISQRLTVPVSIGQMSGTWSYLDPTVELSAVSIGVGNAFKLENISVSLDSIAMLRERIPVVKGFSANGVRLSVSADDGKWGVDGLPRSDKPMDLSVILTSSKYLSAFEISDVAIQINGKTSSFLVKSNSTKQGELQRFGDQRTLVLPLLLEHRGTEFDLLLGGKFEGSPGDDDYASDFYLGLPLIEVLDFLPSKHTEKLKLRRLALGGEYWFSTRGDTFELLGQSQLEANFTEKEYPLRTDLSFATKGISAGEVTISVPTIIGEFAGAGWQLRDIGLAYEPGPDTDQIAVQIPIVEIDELVVTALKMGRAGLLLNSDQMEVLSNLAPSGDINSLFGVVTLGETLDYHVTGLLDGVSVQRYKALPVISDLNGMVSIRPTGGFLDMINETPFVLQFPGMFDDPWQFDSAKTRVVFSVSDDGIQAQTGLVEATHGDLLAKGRVHLRLPGDPLQTTWGLELGVQHADLLDAFRYLPNTLKEDVRSWLKRAILAGASHESGMVFHGSLAKDADKDEKVHQLYFKVTDTILDYDPAWPRFDDLAATIFIDNFEISSNDANGQVYDSQVSEAMVMVPISAQGVADTILVDGELAGGFGDGVRVLTETPLFAATNRMADGWLGEGLMSGRVKMNIPLGDRVLAAEPTLVDLALSIDQVDLEMPSFDLKFQDLTGSFRYESHESLSSSGFSAQLFDEAVTGEMKSLGDISGGEIIVTLDGRVDSNDLFQWSKQPLLSRANGIVQYQSNLHVFYGNRSQEPIYVNATSELLGVELSFPRPLGKASDETMELEYKQIFGDEGYRIELSLGEEVKAKLKIVGDSLAGGRLHFGHEPMGATSFDKLAVSGDLAHVIYEDWDQLTVDLEKYSEGSLEDELVETLEAVEVTIGLFDVFGFEMENVLTRVTRSPAAWHVDLDNDWMLGRVSVSDNDDVPLTIAMEKLIFDAELESVGGDPLGQTSPAELTAAQFSVEQLLLDGDDYGSWSFLYQPNENGASLEGLKVDVRGLQVADDASVLWEFIDGQHRSHFTGTVLMPDLGSALRQWGYASSIEGEDFRIFGDVSWPGSPAMAELETIDGLVRLMKGEGTFVQADSNMGALRVLGIFDFASLMRRFRILDFSDVVKSGFSFTNISGETRFKSGVIDVVDPILIEGSGSILKVGGRVNLNTQELDNDMIVTLPVNRNLPWYAAYSAIVTGPLTGAGVFLAQKVFQNQINAMSSAKYKITGTMDEPIIEFVTIFSDSVRDAPDDSAPPGE